MTTHTSLTVHPPVSGRTATVLAELAGDVPGVHRIWRGQPGARSPWRVRGAVLELDARSPEDPVAWLRFLLREVLAPASQGAQARATALGLDEQHRVHGWFGASDETGAFRLVDVSGTRVRVGGRGRARDAGPVS